MPGPSCEHPCGGCFDFWGRVPLFSTGCLSNWWFPCLGLQVYEYSQHNTTYAALTTTLTPMLQRHLIRWTDSQRPWSVVKFQYEGAWKRGTCSTGYTPDQLSLLWIIRFLKGLSCKHMESAPKATARGVLPLWVNAPPGADSGFHKAPTNCWLDSVAGSAFL